MKLAYFTALLLLQFLLFIAVYFLLHVPSNDEKVIYYQLNPQIEGNKQFLCKMITN